MRKLALYCGLLAFAGAAFFAGEAEGWKFLSSFPTPGSEPRGISVQAGDFIVQDDPISY